MKQPGLRVGLGVGLAVGVAVGLALGIAQGARAGGGTADTVARVRNDILGRHPAPPAGADLDYAAVRGMTGTLDRWTRFYAPSEVAAATTEPADMGIGATWRTAPCGLVAVTVSGPAAEAGLGVGDCVTTVDGTPLANVAEGEREARLLGAPRSASTLVVTRAPGGPNAGGTALVAVRRGWRSGAPLETADVELPGGRRATWITVRSFAAGVTDLLGDHALADVVVDLRGNPGGEMSEGVRFLDRFVTEGELLQSAVRGEPPKTWSAKNDGTELGERVVVLVDAGTASASEIVAGGLKARRGATIVGQPMVGKRSIQTVLRYEDGSALQLTIGGFTPASDPLVVDAPVATTDTAGWRTAAAAALTR